jgi:hypothetical protein
MFLGNKARPARKADNLAAICEPTVWKTQAYPHLTILQAFTACYGDSFTMAKISTKVAISPEQHWFFASIMISITAGSRGLTCSVVQVTEQGDDGNSLAANAAVFQSVPASLRHSSLTVNIEVFSSGASANG